MPSKDDLLDYLPHRGGHEKTWSLTTTAAALAAAAGTRVLLRRGWKRFKGEDPPRNPATSSVAWKDALAWTVATAVAVGVARLLAHRAASAGWKKATGDRPPL